MRFVITFCLVFLFTGISFGQQENRLNVPTLSPLSEVTQEVALTNVKLSYSRPGAKGRKIFGELVPYGEVWRTGANASTKLTFTEDVKIEGNNLKAGTYALYTIPNKNQWTIIVHTNTSHRSIAGDVYKKSEDAFRFTVKPEKTDDFIETWTIKFTDISTDSCYLEMSWENTLVKFKIEFDVDGQVKKQIAELEKAEGGMNAFNYFLAAEYNYHNDKNLEKAVEWIKTGLEKSPKNFRFGLLHAKILAKQGKKAEALKVIEEANSWAKAENNSNYIEQTQLFWDSIK